MVNLIGMKMLSEFIGTFILAASIEFITEYEEGGQKNLLMAILGGFFIAVTLTREISGGHINPGVTLSVYFAEQDQKIKTELASQLWMYIFSQAAGACTAVFLGMMIYDGNIFRLNPHPSSGQAEAFVLEILGTFVFYLTILTQGYGKAHLTNDKTLSTLCVTAGLAGGIAMSGNISGASVNPALGFAFNFGRLLSTGHIEECKYLWAYLFGPVAGAFLASLFYNNIFRSYFDGENEDDNQKKLIDNEDFQEMKEIRA